MPHDKRKQREDAIRRMLDDMEASQWPASRMYAIVQDIETRLGHIIETLQGCLGHDMRPEQRAMFREQCQELLETFIDDAMDVLQPPQDR